MSNGLSLPGLVGSRIGVSAIFMTYPACLAVLRKEWDMSGAEAGMVQGAFTAAFAASLLITSILSDRFGARRIFLIASVLSAVSALFFAGFARSYETALVASAMVGLSQGGTYTPALILISANVPLARKSSAMGWVLAGMSAGYVISIVLSNTALSLSGYVAAFWVCAAITAGSLAFAWQAVEEARESTAPEVQDDTPLDADMRRRARLLTVGYIGHTWELLGAWAWIPAFLAAAMLTRGEMSGVELGVWTALCLHATGFFASFLSGHAADRFGTRTVLIFFAALGVLCSAVIGWLPGAPVWLILLVAALYGFATIGDSAVLSSAMTDAVPLRHLGKMLGIRSILGMGGGAVSPVVFGFALDVTPVPVSWGVAFSTLAVGGAVALVCALAMPRPGAIKP